LAFRLTSEVHLVSPPGNEQRTLAYFPLESLVFEVNAAGRTLLETLRAGPVEPPDDDSRSFLAALAAAGVLNGVPAAIPGGPSTQEPRPFRLVLLPSNRCNLRCVYCYREAGAAGTLMPNEVALAAVELALCNAEQTPERRIELGFHGGGEPTLNWDVMVRSTEHAERRARARNLHLTTSLCTNGMLDPDQVDWAVSHMHSVIVSVDGPPELQNLQRPLADGGPSFERVASTLDRLAARGKRVGIRLTATEHSQGRLERAVEFLAERFRPRTIQVEPLFTCGRCSQSGCQPPTLESFLDAVPRAQALARAHDCAVQCSGARFRFLDTRFCGAAGSNFFVTADGDVTSCLEVTDARDARAELFFYGRYRSGPGFQFHHERFARLRALRVQAFSACADCFARWHCGGDCLAKSPAIERIPVERNQYRCAIIKHLTLRQLASEVDRSRANRTKELVHDRP
jgi:uncharacterized protein